MTATSLYIIHDVEKQKSYLHSDIVKVNIEVSDRLLKIIFKRYELVLFTYNSFSPDGHINHIAKDIILFNLYKKPQTVVNHSKKYLHAITNK
jgi:hypothetical protein